MQCACNCLSCGLRVCSNKKIKLITTTPQSTDEVERIFSHLNDSKNKLRDCLAVCILEAIIKSSENFPGDFEVNQRLTHFAWQSKEKYFDKLENSEAVGATTGEIFYL